MLFCWNFSVFLSGGEHLFLFMSYLFVGFYKFHARGVIFLVTRLFRFLNFWNLKMPTLYGAFENFSGDNIRKIFKFFEHEWSEFKKKIKKNKKNNCLFCCLIKPALVIMFIIPLIGMMAQCHDTALIPLCMPGPFLINPNMSVCLQGMSFVHCNPSHRMALDTLILTNHPFIQSTCNFFLSNVGHVCIQLLTTQIHMGSIKWPRVHVIIKMIFVTHTIKVQATTINGSDCYMVYHAWASCK